MSFDHPNDVSQQVSKEEVKIIMQDNVKRGLDEFSRRTDWHSCWRSAGESGTAEWFIKFSVEPTLVKVVRTRFIALMGTNFAKWFDERPNTVLDMEIVNRWMIPRNNRKSRNMKGWNVIFVVYAGSREERLGFTAGCYYGTDKEQGRELSSKEQGDWHEICFYSLHVDRFSGLQRESSLASSVRVANNKRVGAPKFSIIVPPRHRILDEIDAYCYNRPGVARQIGAIGYRKGTRKTEKFIKNPNQEVFMGGKTGCCAMEALINGLKELKGDGFAQDVMENAPLFTGRDLTDLGKFIEHELLVQGQRSDSGFDLRHAVKGCDWSRVPIDDAVKMILNLPQGVYIAHVKGVRTTDHAFVLNTSSFTIIDSMEAYHLELCEASILLSCGSEKIFCFKDVRRLVQKSTGKRYHGGYSRRVRAKYAIMKKHGLL